jgi:hypothetical protein
MIRTAAASEWEFLCRVNDLHELVDQLQTQRDALVHRERIHELEIVAQRRELELRFVFEATLEERLRECQQQIEVLHTRTETDMQRRFAIELAAERDRTAEAQRERDEIRRELGAERQRISYRTVQRVVVPVTRGRVFFAKLQKPPA